MTYLSGMPVFPFSELCALRLDGELTSFHHFLDVPDEPRDRGRRILGRYAEVLVLSSWSAAWSLGCSPEPAQHIAAYRQTRVHIPEEANLIVEQRSLKSSDISEMSTSPLRTVSDLLKIKAEDPLITTTVHTLMSRFAITSAMVIDRLSQNPTPAHKRLMLARLEALERLYPSETR
jgi:hypothetical protein